MIEERAEVAETMLLSCGELGYVNVELLDVLERSDCSRLRFYRLFTDKADCYTQAYGTEIERLCDALLAAAAAEKSWRAGLRAALNDLALFIIVRPSLAKGLLVEVHSAGEPALAERTRMLARMTEAVDLARAESDSPLSPPAITGEFLVSAIESTAARALASGEPTHFARAVPDLAHLVVMAYFGRDAAREELTPFLRSV